MHSYLSMHLKKCILAGLVLFATIPNANSQPLNLYDAVNKTLANYPLILQRESEVASSRAHITTINGNRLPALRLIGEATAGTSNSLPGSYFPLGVIPSTSGSIRASNNGSLSSGTIAISYLDWQFYTFGYYNAQQKEAKAQLAASKAGLESDKYLLSQSVITLYLDWLKKYQLMKVEMQNVERTRTILNAIKATVNSGLKPGVDSATASAEYARARIAYLQALGDYKYDQAYLHSYTGTDTTGIAPDTSIFTGAFLDKIKLFEPADSVAGTHPLLDLYEKQYEQQAATGNAIAHRYLPRVAFEGAGWQRGSSISSTDMYAPDALNATANTRYNYLLGLSLSYNLFDIKHRHDELKENSYRTDAAAHALQNQQLELNRLLQQAGIGYNTTMLKLQELPVRLRSATQAYGQQVALYRAGLNTLTDVTTALYVLNQSETDLVLAQDDMLQLLYLRAGLSGQLDTFLQNFK
ncbi:MAG: TolC family protein [Flavipsychrobacter sp.]|nr:TolC family protein [Flavipsychrobacter sp.]